MRKHRQASEAESALFRDALKDATPLARRRAPPQAPAPPGITVTPPKPPVHAGGPAPAIGGHREAHLRRGKAEPEAKLDLHGRTQEAAHRALHDFLVRARQCRWRVVLVITGKGGVLRDLVPRWLGEYEFRDIVSGVSPAHVRHGGAGAYYVALRRPAR